ncbi:uncharacterized, partial [Tachysurus ichikawai]
KAEFRHDGNLSVVILNGWWRESTCVARLISNVMTLEARVSRGPAGIFFSTELCVKRTHPRRRKSGKALLYSA